MTKFRLGPWARPFIAHCSSSLLASAALFLAPAYGQVVPQLPPGVSEQQALETLQQNPQLQEQVRQRILGSGLSPTDIQQRLLNAGFPRDLLDSYLFDPDAAAATLDLKTMRAISVLGVNAFLPEDFEQPVVMERPAAMPDTSAPSGALALFGLDAFRRPSTAFEPLVTGPVDGSYVLGPGDVLVLFLTGAVQRADILEVTREGFAVVPRIGQVWVNDVTLDQFRDLLYERLAQAYSGISRSPKAKTRFDISVARVRAQTLRVIGEVRRPGAYSVAATGGVLSALYEAGGLKPSGSFRRVEVRRGTELVGTVDLYDYLLKGVVSNEIRLRGGDVVFVPVHGPHVRIAGEVPRPAIYELRPGETLRDLVQLAGGVTAYASLEAATVDRVLPPEARPAPGHNRTVVTVKLGEALRSASAGVPLMAEDSVTIFSIRGGRRGAVTVAGSVWQPGTYALAADMRLRDAIEQAGGLKPEAYLGRVQILRTRPDSTRQILGFALDRDAPAGGTNDPLLVEGDEITVFATTDFRPARYVEVNGAVNRPGRVAFADSMTLWDAIMLAGGLSEGAYLAQAEISRLGARTGAATDSLALILRVPLDSSYPAEGTGSRDGLARPPAVTVQLQPHDHVFVRFQPGWALQRNVTLTGEVRFPGTYTLTRQDERLLDVLQRAGGLTSDAYPGGIQLRRSKDQAGRIPVDLPRVLRNPGHRDNVALEPGDSIYIPRFIPVVKVEGAVHAPASVTYRPGAGLGYYVDAAGGYTARADKKRAYVLQPNGLIEKGGQPQPGAVIQVPQKDPTERGSTLLMVLGAMAPIVSAATTILVALIVQP